MARKSKCKSKYNDGYTHEALHSAHIAMCIWDNHVLLTRCADKFPDVKNAVLKAETAMSEAYQLIGSKFND